MGMMSHAVFNYVEACFWAGLGVIFLLSSFKTGRKARKTTYAGAAVLLLFGLSDVVEASSGAWWRPWWLLVWKAACIAGILGCFLRYYRKTRG